LLTVENVLLLKPTKEYDVWGSHSGKYGGSRFLGNVGIPVRLHGVISQTTVICGA